MNYLQIFEFELTYGVNTSTEKPMMSITMYILKFYVLCSAWNHRRKVATIDKWCCQMVRNFFVFTYILYPINRKSHCKFSSNYPNEWQYMKKCCDQFLSITWYIVGSYWNNWCSVFITFDSKKAMKLHSKWVNFIII